ENPYTAAYLEHLLHKHGFEEIVRYHGVNGFFPVSMERRMLKDVAMFPAHGGNAFNTYTARKPGLPGYSGPTTSDPAAVTRGAIEVRATRLDAARRMVFLKVDLTNQGEAAWLHQLRSRGQVTLALHQGAP